MILTLLTDFGTRDYFVAAMKGAILCRDETITIVDLTHEVPRHDVAAAAFILDSCYRDFPPGTVHVVVVDPGVGSSRRNIAVLCGEHRFVAPDNGVLAPILAGSDVAVRSIDPGRIGLPGERIGSTFHGRDLLAPAGAALASGHPFEAIGPEIADPIAPAEAGTELLGEGRIAGRVQHIDRFGNCVTTLRRGDLPDGIGRYVYSTGEAIVERSRVYYSAGGENLPFAIWGSAGYLELSVDRGSAAEVLGVSIGDDVVASRRAG